jgi:hypothetical protein
MPGIEVGINENVVLTKTAKNDKGTLVLGLKKNEAVDPIAALNSSTGSTNFEQREKELLIYPPQLTDFNNQPKTGQEIMNSFKEIVDPLAQIASQYVTKDKISWDTFKNTDITAENVYAEVVKPEVVKQVYNNIVDQFVRLMAPFVGENGPKMRWLLVRQSKAKHFPRLRTRFLQGNPFIEPMTIPAAASKVKFTQYEIDNGLNNGSEIKPQAAVSESESQAVAKLFAE